MIAFFDGSGTINDSPVYVMAGYLAPARAWDAFAIEWQAALDRPKAIEYFKMSEAWGRRGQFEGWDETLRDARLRVLPPIINRHAIASVILAVASDGWKDHVVGRLSNRYHDRPYFFAFHTIMAAVVRYLADKGINEKVSFVLTKKEENQHASCLTGLNIGWNWLRPFCANVSARSRYIETKRKFYLCKRLI